MICAGRQTDMNRIKEKSANRWLLWDSFQFETPSEHPVLWVLIWTHLWTCTFLSNINRILMSVFAKASLRRCFDVSVGMLFLCLCQVRHAAANVLRECWLLHRTNLKRGNGGEHRRHQRCLLEAIRVWVIVSLHKRFRPLFWIKGVSGWRLMAPVFHVCILWIVKRASTCFGCRVTILKAELLIRWDFSYYCFFFFAFFVWLLHALTHFCYSLLSCRCIVNCGTSWFRA